MAVANKSRIFTAFQLLTTSPKINRRYQSHSGTFNLEKPIKMRVKWIRYKKKGWCQLNSLNLEKVASHGIYIIWKPQSHVIRIGRGDVASELHTQRNNPNISKFGQDLLVTWTTVPQKYIDGIERFLYEQFSPINADRIINSRLIQVNLPGKGMV